MRRVSRVVAAMERVRLWEPNPRWQATFSRAVRTLEQRGVLRFPVDEHYSQRRCAFYNPISSPPPELIAAARAAEKEAEAGQAIKRWIKDGQNPWPIFVKR